MPYPGGPGWRGITEIAPPTYKKGRNCRYPGCKTILSIYNDDNWCAQHIQYKPEPPPTDLELYFKQCQGKCGEWKNGHAYARDRYAPDRLDYICTACRRHEKLIAKRKEQVRVLNGLLQKKCTVCGVRKPANLDFFPWSKSGYSHLKQVCLECEKDAKGSN